MNGRWTLKWTRMLRADTTHFVETGEPYPDGLDVLHAVGAERLLFRSRYELLVRITGVYNLNRYFRDDRFNLHLALGVRARW